MGKVYLIKCQKCDLEFKLGSGVGGSTLFPKTRFFCEDCEKISLQPQCDYCGKYLKRIIFPLEGNLMKIQESGDNISVKCPHCGSSQTIVKLLDEWVMNNQTL